MKSQQPIKIFRGSVEEVLSRRDEIPPDAYLVLNVFEPMLEAEEEPGDFGGKSAADIIREIGFVDGLPSDLSTNPKHMEGFGETKNRRKL
ncbi:MAG: hypothetical protein JWN14_1169 [Chthonomonadales bacterium]|nr:hypothetical protein [Chthonomonadales bacterium]